MFLLQTLLAARQNHNVNVLDKAGSSFVNLYLDLLVLLTNTTAYAAAALSRGRLQRLRLWEVVGHKIDKASDPFV